MHGLAPCVVREELIAGVADRPAVLQWLRASNKPVVVVVMGQELVIPLGTKVLTVLCQSDSVIRQSSRSDTRDIRLR